MAEDNIPPTPPGFRPPPPWAFGGAPAQNYYAPPAPPANDDELTRLRAENARLRQRQQSGDDVESRLRGEYQDAIAQAMGRLGIAAYWLLMDSMVPDSKDQRPPGSTRVSV